ncbi:MAG: radical SAM/SPASM domain-containing protein [Burkholderiaceae bacterium]
MPIMRNLLETAILNTRKSIRENCSFRFFDGGCYGINYKNGVYYFIEETGAFIIKNILSGNEINTKQISKDFNIEESVVVRDFTNFLVQFEDSKLPNNPPKDIAHDLNDENFLNYFTENKIPLTTIIEITEACNEHCIHCYRPEPKKEFWTTEKFDIACSELAQLGSLQIDFTGGEPFLKKGFREYLKIADYHGFIISILTNATLISDSDIDLLKNIKIRSLYVSLYSSSAAIHDAITKLPGSFEKTILTIKKLKEYDLPVFINSPIMDINKNCPDGIKHLVTDLGLDVKFTYKISESYSKKRETKKLNIYSKEEMQRMINNPNVKLYSDIIDKRLNGQIQTRSRMRSCDTGFRSITISPEGDIIPCTALRMKCGNIAEASVQKIWYESEQLQYWRDEGSLVKNECKSCDSYDFCEPCPAGYYAKNGNLDGIDEVTCGFGKTFSSCVSCT